MQREIIDLGGSSVAELEHLRNFDGKTPGDTRLFAYDQHFAEAVLEQGDRYFRIEACSGWVPLEINEGEAGLAWLEMIPASNTPHLRRRAHLDQVIGRVRRRFNKSGVTVNTSIMRAIPRPE